VVKSNSLYFQDSFFLLLDSLTGAPEHRLTRPLFIRFK